MRGDFFDFNPTHKLLISGNTKPSLRYVDEAIRRRFILIPFMVMILEGERDSKLVEKLKAEWPAILGWMVDGYLEYKQIGLKVPEGIRQATADYLADQDTLAPWIADCTEIDSNAFTLTGKLFKSWKEWCGERNLASGTVTAFSDSLKERGYHKVHKEHGNGFNGLKLRKPPEPQEPELPIGE